EADPGWTTLHPTTPPYPAYASNASAIGAASATVLAGVFGSNDVPFEVDRTTQSSRADSTSPPGNTLSPIGGPPGGGRGTAGTPPPPGRGSPSCGSRAPRRGIRRTRPAPRWRAPP